MIDFGIALSSSLIFVALGLCCWFFRDGLGPDAIESFGGEAWRRFIAGFWPAALICFVLFVFGILVAPRQSSTHTSSTDAPGNTPQPMSIAPEPILRAGNDTVAWACIFIRNQTVREGASTKMINDAMEAIHEVPRMLTNWRPDSLLDVRIHLGCFPAARWPDAPDLVAFFEQKLRDYGHDDNVA